MSSINRTVVAPLSSAIVAVLIAGVIAVGIDTIEPDLRDGEARLVANGKVEVALDGGQYVEATRNRLLAADDRVRVLSGTATLELPRDSSVELRAGSTVALPSGPGPDVELLAGDLLVMSGGETIAIDSGTVTVDVTGSAKLRRDRSVAAGVYAGDAVMHSQGGSIGVPEYRQAAAVGTGLLPDAPRPLQLSEDDTWDIRLAGEVLRLDEQLTGFGATFEAGVSGPVGPEVYRRAVPDLSRLPFGADALRSRAPAENLIGLVLVSLARGDFKERVDDVFGFRSEGASWGLVSADNGLNPNPVIDRMEFALGTVGAVPGEVALNPIDRVLRDLGRRFGARPAESPGPGGAGDGTSEEASGPDAGVPGGGGSEPGGNPGGGGSGGSGGGGNPGGGGGGGNPGGGGGGGGGGTPDPDKVIDLPRTGTLLDGLVDPLEDLLAGVLDGVLGVGSGPSPDRAIPPAVPTLPQPSTPPVGPTTDTTGGGLLGVVTDALEGPPDAAGEPDDGLVGTVTDTVGGVAGVVGGLLGG